jgi:hypothetical protein
MTLAAGPRENRGLSPDLPADLLSHFATKYVWWKPADEALRLPDRVIAQVMNLGDYDDVQALSAHLGEDRLRDVVRHAEAGQLDERSWTYWHYRLGLAAPEQVPPMPQRRLA